MKKLLFIALLFLPFTCQASLVPSHSSSVGTLSQGLVGWWTFDGQDLIKNVADRSGNGNTGYLQNFGATSSAVVVGKMGQALQFNGINNYLTGTSAVTTYPFTVNIWFKATNPVALTDIFSLGNSGTASPYCVIGWDSNKYLYSQIRGDDGSSSATLTTNSMAYNDGKWHMATLIIASLNDERLIIDNGTPITKSNSLGTSITFNRQTAGALGRTSFTAFAKVSADDIRIYNRALSASEILELYNQTKINYSASVGTLNQGLIGWWTFDGNNLIQNVTDRSGNNNNGFLQNVTATSSKVVPGKIGQGFDFTANNTAVKVGTTDFIGTGDATFCAWIYQKSAASNDTAIYNGKFQFIQTTSNRWYFSNDGVTTLITPVSTIVLNRWDFYCATRSGTDGNIYQNGMNIKSGAAGTPTSGTTAVYIGNNSGSTHSLGGYMDDVRLYGRALSALEIQQLYNAGKGVRI